MILVYIPIRSGSKGLPNKNLLSLAGYPLFYWSIRFAQLLTDSSHIIVSSDSPLYLQIASSFNCSTLLRDKANATDTTSTEQSMVADLLGHPLVNHATTKWICLLQATSPFRTKDTASSILNLIQDSEIDSLVGVYETYSFLWTSQDQHLLPTYDLRNRPRRQDILASTGRQYIETGSVYLTRTSQFINTGLRVSGSIIPVDQSPLESIEIDSFREYKLMQSIFHLCDLFP